VPSLVVDADAVGEIATYVAPGFMMFLGYRARYPAPPRPAGEVVVISVVGSLPLVALVAALLPGDQRASQLGYVALLLGVGWLAGYMGAILRGSRRVRSGLLRLGYRIQPEGSIYAQTLNAMSSDGSVVVELKDGRRVWGCPRNGPQCRDDGIAELYLVYPKAEDDAGRWQPVGEGLIVPLSEVSTITLSEEPTGAPIAA
jgi:hypothetical protein